ncbi:MAG TPA: hypothetical protein VG841_00075 [Caulobacterales bacterium]|nr:hypothetical protein [Caulobacterales bacterium]
MADPETARTVSRMRLRLVAWTASVALVGVFVAVLVVSSKTLLRDAPPVIRAYVEAQLHPAPDERARPARTRGDVSAAASAQAPASSDSAALADALICFSRDRERRRAAQCPEALRPQWDPNARLPGELPRDSQVPAYNFGELVLRNPGRCELDGGGVTIVKVCQSLYRDPPPPSRAAEEICEAGGVGPCHPPPFTGPIYARRH